MNRTKRMAAAVLAALLILPVLLLPANAAQGSMPFQDVKTDSWMCKDVSYCYFNGLMKGRTADRFCPRKQLTRAEFVTILGRIFSPDLSEYRPESEEAVFEDVESDSYYAAYVYWALQNGITKGVTESLFGPKQEITRQDAAVMIARSEALADPDLLAPEEDPAAFPDQGDISGYAKEAVSLLQRQGILQGGSGGLFRPRSTITRAEAAALLGRYHCRLQNHCHSYKQIAYYDGTCVYRPRRKMGCACGSYYVEETGKALGHDFRFQAYSADRKKILLCSRCGETKYEPLPEAKRIYSGDSLLRYDEIISWVDQLSARYPDLMRVSTAGKSCQGANIPVVEFGKGSRRILLNGNIHAREYITTNYLLEVLDEYAYAYVKDEKIGNYRVRPLLDAFTLVVIPCSNPDGRAIAIEKDPQYKNNARNVNLNQNFPTNWHYLESGENGPSAGSEPETQALLSLLGKYSFELVLDCHTAGNVLYYADGDCTAAHTRRAKALADAMSAESGFTPMTFMANPGFANYARHPYGCLGFTVEMWPTYEHPIDCSGFYAKVWNPLKTLPAIAMNWLLNN